jgi:hypothetical protein
MLEVYSVSSGKSRAVASCDRGDLAVERGDRTPEPPSVRCDLCKGDSRFHAEVGDTVFEVLSYGPVYLLKKDRFASALGQHVGSIIEFCDRYRGQPELTHVLGLNPSSHGRGDLSAHHLGHHIGVEYDQVKSGGSRPGPRGGSSSSAPPSG